MTPARSSNLPVRIQRQRTKGWRMPPGAVYVGRPGKWGNPFEPGKPSGVFPEGIGLRGAAETLIPAMTIEQVITFYREMVEGMLRPEMYPAGHQWRDRFAKLMGGWSPQEAAMTLLRGKTLCCWCVLGQPCHADILLEIANR